MGWVLLMGVANGHSNSNDADVLVERTQTTLVPTLSSDGCLHFAESYSMHRNKRGVLFCWHFYTNSILFNKRKAKGRVCNMR